MRDDDECKIEQRALICKRRRQLKNTIKMHSSSLVDVFVFDD